MSLLEYKIKLRNMAAGANHRHEALIRCDGSSVDVVMMPYAVSVEFDKRDGVLTADDVLHVGVYSADDFSREDPLAPPQIFSLSGVEAAIPKQGTDGLVVEFEPKDSPFSRCPRCGYRGKEGSHTLLECFVSLQQRIVSLETEVEEITQREREPAK
jgi:hypothetical protein